MQTPIFYTVKPIDASLRRLVQPIVNDSWAAPLIVVNGVLWDTRKLPGLAAVFPDGTIAGYLLYAFHDGVCEIMALESLRETIGIGTRLIAHLQSLVIDRGIKKVVVMTTNDNLNAIRFYQKRGFTLRALRPNMVEVSRRLKPGIPSIGNDGIPLRDEIELELDL